jgi:GMP synthase (glutamine-hydrolysing)
MSRVFNFNRWKKRKIAVFHMWKSPAQLTSALDLLEIPHYEFDCEDEHVVKKLIDEQEEFCGIIISGGLIEPYHVKPSLPKELLDLNVPKIGICLGHEILGVHLGSELIDCNQTLGEHGDVIANLQSNLIFEGIELPGDQTVRMEHQKMLSELPKGAELIASTNLTPIGGFHHSDTNTWGLQFHPEKDWIGDIVFRNFYKFCYTNIK